MDDQVSKDDGFSDNAFNETKDVADGSRRTGLSAAPREKVGPEDEKREALDGESSAAQKVRDDFRKAKGVEAEEAQQNVESVRHRTS